MRGILAHGIAFIRGKLKQGWAFVRQNSGFVLIAFAPSVLLIIAAIFLMTLRLSYSNPGPALGAVGLALMMLGVGVAVCVLYARKESPPSSALLAAPVIKGETPSSEGSDEYDPPALPQIEGMELLFERWQQFQQSRVNPNKQQQALDSAALCTQIQIALSLAQLAFKEHHKISFVKMFYGYKIERGAFLIQPGNAHPLVLKFDSIAHIEQEKERYQRFVEPLLGNNAGKPWKPLQRPIPFAGEAWGAITYNLISARRPTHIQTLGQYYKTHDIAQIQKALKQVFMLLDKSWWGEQKSPEKDSLYREYDRLSRKAPDILSSPGTKREPKIADLAGITSKLTHIVLSGIRLRNPFNWLIDTFEKEKLDSWVANRGFQGNSIVHGDFHSGNILIEDRTEGPEPWVIDFPHTHVGPTVQDLARLEADVKFNLLPLESLDIAALHEFELSLLPPHNPTSRTTPAALMLASKTRADLGDEMFKAWEVIRMLRDQIQDYMASGSARPYYLALLHATLPQLYYVNRTNKQKIYAFISAALLCERL